MVLGNVIKKEHAKFQETSSIGNAQKSRGTADDTHCDKNSIKHCDLIMTKI